MKKIIIALSSILVLAAAGISGIIYYHTIPSKAYKTDYFSFKVPQSFKATSEASSGDNYYTFKSDDASISICNYDIMNSFDTISAYATFHLEGKDTVPEKLLNTPYNGYFFSSERNLKDDGKLHMKYVLNADTYFLNIDAYCKPSAEERVKKDLDRIVKRVKYKNDNHIENKPDVYDFDYVSINTGSKYICADRTIDFEGTPFKSDLIIREQLAEIDNPDKLFLPCVNIAVKKYSDSSPAERAGESYNSAKENIEEFNTLIRDQQEMFGVKCEHVYFELNSSSDGEEKDCISRDQYFFEKDGLLYEIFASYHADTDKTYIEEMLSGITIKDTIQK